MSSRFLTFLLSLASLSFFPFLPSSLPPSSLPSSLPSFVPSFLLSFPSSFRLSSPDTCRFSQEKVTEEVLQSAESAALEEGDNADVEPRSSSARSATLISRSMFPSASAHHDVVPSVSKKSRSVRNTAVVTGAPSCSLRRCVRLWGHEQNTTGFFVAVFEKRALAAVATCEPRAAAVDSPDSSAASRKTKKEKQRQRKAELRQFPVDNRYLRPMSELVIVFVAH